MKKMVCILVALALCLGTSICASASSTIGKEEQTQTYTPPTTLPDVKYDQLSDSTYKNLQALFGASANIKAVKIYDNNGYILYSVCVNDKKVGWYLLSQDSSLVKFDPDKHNYIFKNLNKISSDLGKLINSATDDQLIPVYVITEDVDHNTVDAQLAKIDPAAYQNEIRQDNGEDLSVDDAQDIIMARRQIYANMYTAKNHSVIDKYLDSGDKTVFISAYSPLNIVEMKKADIERISKDDKVISLFPYVEEKVTNDLVTATQVIQADYVRDTLGYDGTGVKIGQFEEYSPSNSDTELDSGCVTYRYSPHSTDDHATEVATIMVGDTLGIAPGATLYSTYRNGATTFYQEIEWLISQGVNVINMSMYLDINGQYDIYSQWIDHLAKVHSVHFVKSAGNEGLGGDITSPGMGYNIFTVGGFDDGNTAVYTDDIMADFSSSIEDSSAAEKPDLIAPAVDIYFPHFGDTSGTSFAAPMTTATIAQMIDINSALATKQVAMKAILMASAFRKIPGFTGISQELPLMADEQGAGKLDSKNARYIVSNSRYVSTTINRDTDYFKTFSVNASSSQVRVALCWLKQNSISGDHSNANNLSQIPLADYDLLVEDPNGGSVGNASISFNNNVEIVEFDPTISGTYTIRVTYVGGDSAKETIALAWW
jgi:hypothetical protein